ncbi:MAG: KpsF/GutQ family sugar-phosphate isomerase [Verrucomicrobiota bacterium]
MDYLEKGREVIRLEASELERLLQRLDDRFGQAVLAFQEAIEGGHKIVVVGVGKSGNIGHKIAATLNSTGATTVVLHSQNALHGDLGVVDEGDVVLALSQRGETKELLDLLPFLRRAAGTVVGMTGVADSSLGRNCDIHLDTSVDREACPLNLAPTSSTTVMLVLGDALAMVLLEARGFGSDDFARLHPSGSLGRVLLTRVDDVMRTEPKLATVSPDDRIDATLKRMTECRSGAAVVIDKDGTLEGIFTHGDFVRAFQEDPSLGRSFVREYMTKNPVTIESGRLATEALRLLEEHRVDDLIVVDSASRPVGLIDTQDLTRLRLV